MKKIISLFYSKREKWLINVRRTTEIQEQLIPPKSNLSTLISILDGSTGAVEHVNICYALAEAKDASELVGTMGVALSVFTLPEPHQMSVSRENEA